MCEKKWDIFIYGDVNIDLVIPDVSELPGPGEEVETETMETFVGGGAALFALGLSKLGARVAFQGSVGGDLYGDYILNVFRKQGMDCTLLQRRESEKTGISLSFTNEKDRSFLTMRGTNEHLNITEIDFNKLKSARHFHVTGYAFGKNHDGYLQLLKKIKKETDLTVSFDLGWDSTGLWSKRIYELFPYIDVLFMNESEALGYSGKNTPEEAARDFVVYGPLVVLKLGVKGSMATAEDNGIIRRQSFKVKAVDTTGAGDSFNAGFIYGYVNTMPVSDCLVYGNGCGALSVTQLGGNTGFPDLKTLKEFIG